MKITSICVIGMILASSGQQQQQQHQQEKTVHCLPIDLGRGTMFDDTDDAACFYINMGDVNEQEAISKMNQIYDFALSNRALRCKTSLDISPHDLRHITKYAFLGFSRDDITDYIWRMARLPSFPF